MTQQHLRLKNQFKCFYLLVNDISHSIVYKCIKTQHGKIITSNKSAAQNKRARRVHRFKLIVLNPTVYNIVANQTNAIVHRFLFFVEFIFEKQKLKFFFRLCFGFIVAVSSTYKNLPNGKERVFFMYIFFCVIFHIKTSLFVVLYLHFRKYTKIGYK